MQFEGEVQQEGERRRIEAFVLERMHAEVMTDRRRGFIKATINRSSKFESNSLTDRKPVKCNK